AMAADRFCVTGFFVGIVGDDDGFVGVRARGRYRRFRCTRRAGRHHGGFRTSDAGQNHEQKSFHSTLLFGSVNGSSGAGLTRLAMWASNAHKRLACEVTKPVMSQPFNNGFRGQREPTPAKKSSSEPPPTRPAGRALPHQFSFAIPHTARDRGPR